MVKFSIIIPAYNEEQRIGKALESVVMQKYDNFECVVVADACSDRTAEVARRYGVKVIEADFRNDGISRNAGIDNSTGEWLLFLDADDWYLHEYVLAQLDKRLRNNDCDILAFDIVWKHIGVVGPVSGREDGQFFTHCTNKCWKRAFIGDTRFIRVKPGNDAKFQEAVFAKNPKIDIWNVPLYYYNFLREGSCSDTLGRTVEDTIKWWRIDEI